MASALELLLLAEVALIGEIPDPILLYSGTPGEGDLYFSASTSVTTDKYGNPVSAGVNVGDQAGQHVGLGPTGVFLAIADGSYAFLSATDTDNLTYITGSSGDGNTYSLGCANIRLTANQNIASTTPETVFSFAVAAGVHYRVEALIWIEQGLDTSGSAAFQFKLSTGFSAFYVLAKYLNGSQDSQNSIFSDTFSGTDTEYQSSGPVMATASGSYWAEFSGWFTANAAGTVDFQAYEGVSGESYQLLAGTFLDLMPRL